jgi:uncharacterized protein (TIGR03437 family)
MLSSSPSVSFKYALRFTLLCLLVAWALLRPLPSSVQSASQLSTQPSLAPEISTGALNTAREGHTATLLQNGKVLVAGGRNGGAIYNNAEIYDPLTAAWSSAGALSNARYGHSAVLLRNGQVLVLGGQGSNGFLDTAEIYDPVANSWSALSNRMNAARFHTTATLLTSGRVLVAGGMNGSGYLRSAEIYEPTTRTWTRLDPGNNPAGNLTATRAEHTATLLSDGRVLVTGGFNGTAALRTTELFEPNTNRWRRVGDLTAPRRQHTATLLPDNTVLVAGGSNGTAALNSAETYNPATSAWLASGNLAQGRRAHTATLLPNGRVFVAGGRDSAGNAMSSAEVYNFANRTWGSALQAPPFSSTQNFALMTARSEHTATLLVNGQVLLAGGLGNSSTTLNSAELYEYAAGTWGATMQLIAARAGHTATLLPSGKVLVAGGRSQNGASSTVLNSAELYDPNTGTWTATGSLNQARYDHTATLLPNGKVLVAGGITLGQILNSAELYDPVTGAWTSTPAPGLARYRHTATLLPSGSVLVVGGEISAGQRTASAQLYNPNNGANGSWSSAANLSQVRAEHTATLLPNGNVFVFGGRAAANAALNSGAIFNPNSGAWSATSPAAAYRFRHKATLLPNGRVFISGGYGGSITTNVGNTIAFAEVYSPANNRFDSVTIGSRVDHTATLLPNGKVLLVGGFTVSQNNCPFPASLPRALLFDPSRPLGSAAITELYESFAPLERRNLHTATLLTNGRVLFVGGYGAEVLPNCADDILRHSELYDPGLGQQESWRPTISFLSGGTNGSSADEAIAAPEQANLITINGAQFQGISEASGHGAQSSATNYPVAQLLSLGNEQLTFLQLASASGWSNNTFNFAQLTGFAPGPALLTLYTNGIPSVARVVNSNGSGFTFPNAARTGTISGRVVLHNGEGLVANVTLAPTQNSPTGCSAARTITTAPNGEFVFSDLVTTPPVARPTINCGSVQTISQTQTAGGLIINYSLPQATPANATVTCTPPPGSVFPFGSTTVTCTAANSAGSASCSFAVNVATIACPPNQTRNTMGSSAVVTYPAPTIQPSNFNATCTPPSGSVFPVGNTTVVCRINQVPNLSCGFIVTVQQVVGLQGKQPGESKREAEAFPIVASSPYGSSISQVTNESLATPTVARAAPDQTLSCRYNVTPAASTGTRAITFFPATATFNMRDQAVLSANEPARLVAEPDQASEQTCINCTGNVFVSTEPFWNLSGYIQMPNGARVSDVNLEFSVPYPIVDPRLTCRITPANPTGSCRTPGAETVFGDKCAYASNNPLDPGAEFHCACTTLNNGTCEKTVLARYPSPVALAPPAPNTTSNLSGSLSAFDWRLPLFQVNPDGTFNVANVPHGSNAVVTPLSREGGTQYTFSYQPLLPELAPQPFIRIDRVGRSYDNQIITAESACAAPTISAQPINVSVCAGNPAIFSITASGTGLSYQWRKGGVNISGATASSFMIPSVSAGDAGSYDVVINSSCGSVTSNAASLTVNSATIINAQPTNQTACEGAPVAFTVAASGSGALSFQWRKGGVNVSGATASSFTINAVTAGDAAQYDVLVTSGCGTIASAAATLTVNPATAITTQPTNQTVCAGSSATFTVSAAGTNLSYQWRKGGVSIAGATGSSFSLPAVSAGDAAQYDVVVSGACGNVTSAAATLTVNNATAISTQPVSQAVCLGGSATFSVAASGTGTLGYQWRKNGVAIGGATASNFIINAATASDAGNYDVAVTSGCGTLISNVATLTVNALPDIPAITAPASVCANSTDNQASGPAGASGYEWTITNGTITSGATAQIVTYTAGASGNVTLTLRVTNAATCAASNGLSIPINIAPTVATQPVNQTVCENSLVTFTAAANNAAAVQWQVSADGGANFTNVPGATNATLSFTASATQNGALYRTVFSNTCGTVNTNAVTLNVTLLPAISTQPANQTVCENSPVSFTAAANNSSAIQWQVSTDGGANFSNVPGATNSTLNFTANSAQHGARYRAVFTNACGTVATNAALLTVNPLLSISTQPSNQVACAGAAASFNVAASGTAPLSYQWRKNGTPINGATASNFNLAAVTAADAGDYDAVITSACGALTSSVATLTVNPTTAISAQPSSQTVCAGSPVTFNVGATGSGLSYQWRKGGVAINGATSSNYTINAATAADASNYDVIVTGACGTQTSNVANLIVNPATAITAQPTNQATCPGGTVTFSATATGANLSYQWRKNGANINGATASNFTISPVAAGDAAQYDVVVTGSCGTVTSQPVSLNINAATNINTQPANQTACLGGSATFSVAASGAGTLSFQWRKGGVNIPGATASSLTINPATASDAASYDVVVTSDCGVTTSNPATLTISAATAIATQPQPQTVCLGAPASFSVTAAGTNLSYQWRKSGVNIAGATSSAYGLATTAAADAGDYDVVITGACGTVTSNPVALVVNNTTAITTQPSNQTVCAGGNASFSVTATGAGLSYQWRKSGVNIAGATSSSFSLNSTAAVDAGNYEVVVTGACGVVTSNSVSLTVNAATAISTQPTDQTVCAGGNATFTVTANGTNLTYQWRKGGVAINDATNSSYTINAATAADAAQYDVVVTGVCGTATSNAATLTVNAFALSASNATFAAAGGTGAVDLTATVGQCTWNVSSSDNWLTVTSVTSTSGTASNSGTGNGRVNYSVAANPATTSRTGTLTIAGLSFTVTQSGSALAPRIDALSQTSAPAGGAGFTLTVTGANFSNTSVVRWQGSARTTAFISATQLTAQISAADLVTAGTFTIDVFDPPPGGGASNALTFTVIQSNPVPQLTSLSPTSAIAGGGQFTLTVNGANFVNTSVVRWNGTGRSTTFVSATQLTALILASDIAQPGTAQVTVITPANSAGGGGESAALSFTIQAAPPAPTVASMSPSTAVVGGQGFTLTINGSGFTGNTVVRWNGNDRPTTVVNSTRLMATIPASDIAQPGINQVTVFTPPPGGGTVMAISFVVGTQATNVSAASFALERSAAEAITSVFGVELATATASATTLPLPTTLAGTTVKVRDSLGAERNAPLFFVSANQINYLVPMGTALGAATAIITAGNGKISVAALDVQIVAPALFTTNSSGQGVPTGLLLRVRNNQQSFEPLSQLQNGSFVPRPLDLGPAGDQVFLILFGTGMRGRTSLANAVATLGGINLPVSFLGPQGDLIGVDQVNLGPLPRSLAGRGNVNLVLTVEGRAANTVLLNIQ